MILGHKKQIFLLEKILNSRKIPHAFLFVGQEKIGKKKVAFYLAEKILKGNIFSHPDFILLEPLSNSIQIEQVRDLIWRLNLKPTISEKKVAILDKAHLMTREAQNCFLKTLEEPPEDTVIILITPFLDLLLPTIVSRCQIIKFFPVKKEILREFLEKKKIERKEIEKILAICKGRAGLMFEILENLDEMKKIEESLENFEKLSVLERIEFLRQLKNKRLFLEIFVAKLEKEVVEKRSKKAISLLKFIQAFFNEILFKKVDQKTTLEVLAFEI